MILRFNHRKITIIGIIETILVMTLILSCNSIYYVGDYRDLVTGLIPVAIVLMLVYPFFEGRRLTVNTKLASQILLLEAYFGLYFIFRVDQEYYVTYILMFVLALPAFLLFIEGEVRRGRRRSIVEKYSYIMLILSVISLAFYFLGSILNIIGPTGQVITRWGKIRYIPSYYHLYFQAQTRDGVIRNTGIFAEGPMYSYLLSIAIMYEVLFKEKVNYKRVIIFVVTAITTMSTGGVVVSIMVIAIKFALTMPKNKIIRFMKYIIIPVLGGAALMMVLSLINDRLSSGSGVLRLRDLLKGYRVWKEHLYLGTGYSQNLNGASISITTILADGGMYLMCFYAIPMVGLTINLIKNKKWAYLGALMSYLFIFVVTIIQYTPLALFIVIMQWTVLTNYKQSLKLN